MIEPHRTRDPIGWHAVDGAVGGGAGRAVPLYGTVWVNHTTPKPRNPLHPAAVAAKARQSARAARRAAVAARALKA